MDAMREFVCQLAEQYDLKLQWSGNSIREAQAIQLRRVFRAAGRHDLANATREVIAGAIVSFNDGLRFTRITEAANVLEALQATGRVSLQPYVEQYAEALLTPNDGPALKVGQLNSLLIDHFRIHRADFDRRYVPSPQI